MIISEFHFELFCQKKHHRFSFSIIGHGYQSFDLLDSLVKDEKRREGKNYFSIIFFNSQPTLGNEIEYLLCL